MSQDLQPVSFRKGREHEPRLSPPYVPGKRHERYWTDEEIAVVRKHYPNGGAAAALARLPNRDLPAVYRMAMKIGVTAARGQRIIAPEGFDDRLRAFYENDKGRKKGELNAFADKQKMPRWWVSHRARKLGLVIPHKKEPPWTAAENLLMQRVPLHDPDRCAAIFREHGFQRSPTAIVVRAKRLDLSRRYRETLSATAVSKILGIDGKQVTAECINGRLKAEKRPTKRLNQQGGDPWSITPADLRSYILQYLERIDMRKVEKFAFIQIVAGEPLEKPPEKKAPAK